MFHHSVTYCSVSVCRSNSSYNLMVKDLIYFSARIISVTFTCSPRYCDINVHHKCACIVLYKALHVRLRAGPSWGWRLDVSFKLHCIKAD